MAVQPRILTVRRRERLFYLGMAVAILITVVAGFSRSYFLKAQFGTPPLSTLLHLHGLVFTSVVFAILVGAAFYYRHRADVHKRLMTLATVSLLSAPIARLHFPMLPPGPPVFFGLTDLFIVALLIYDLVTRRRVHPATIWGGLLIVVSQPLRLMISGTSAWLAFAGWLTR